jgi:hypothetical protein
MPLADEDDPVLNIDLCLAVMEILPHRKQGKINYFGVIG